MTLPRRLAAGALAVVATVALAELAVRALAPRPRVQVVRHDAPSLRFLDEQVPLWRQVADGDTRGEGCPGDGTVDVVVAGDSIFRTTSAGAWDRVLGRRLEALLSADRPGVCVVDVAESGYLPYQQLEEARRAHERWGAEVLVFGVWKTGGRYTRVGEDWYGLDLVRRTASGLPVPPLPLPDAVHEALFTRSALWEYATLALAPSSGVAEDSAAYAQAIAWARDEGIPAIFVEFPTLARPFEQSLAARRAAEEGRPDAEPRATARIAQQAAAEEAGHDWFVVAEALAGQDHLALRLDACCHYVDDGHAALAEALAPRVAERLPERTP